MVYLTLFVVTFGGVAVRAFQQINVTHGHYDRIPVTSYLFATFDVLMLTNIITIVLDGAAIFPAIAAMGTAGWMGCFTSMWLQKHLNERGGENERS
jgi:hypothetical protein